MIKHDELTTLNDVRALAWQMKQMVVQYVARRAPRNVLVPLLTHELNSVAVCCDIYAKPLDEFTDQYDPSVVNEVNTMLRNDASKEYQKPAQRYLPGKFMADQIKKLLFLANFLDEEAKRLMRRSVESSMVFRSDVASGASDDDMLGGSVSEVDSVASTVLSSNDDGWLLVEANPEAVVLDAQADLRLYAHRALRLLRVVAKENAFKPYYSNFGTFEIRLLGMCQDDLAVKLLNQYPLNLAGHADIIEAIHAADDVKYLPAKYVSLQREVSRGATAKIHQATLHDQSPIAVRRLIQPIENMLDAHKGAMCQYREIKVMKQINSKDIVRFLGYTVFKGNLSILLEWLPGENLYEYLKQHWLNGEKKYWLAVNAIKPILYLHQLFIIHCDIKSPNFMVLPSGQMKLIDFDGAIHKDDVIPGQDFVATMKWVDPGILKGSDEDAYLDLASDIFSLGVVLWEICTGRVPWEAYDQNMTLQQKLINGDRLPIPQHPEKVANLIGHCWAERSKRYTADQLLQVLENGELEQNKFCVLQ